MFSEALATRIGNFSLRFAPGGKLEQLSAHGVPLLHEGTHQLPIDNGKSFTVAGWDECFPTIEAFEDSPVMGQLINAIPQTRVTSEEALQTWTLPALSATRRFQPGPDGGLQIRFQAQNTSAKPRRYLWASHALLSLENVTAITFPGQPSITDLHLNRTSSKSFLPNIGPVQILRPNLTLTLATDQPWWGIWLNLGGWPASAPAGFRCIGIEPTTTNADAPGAAFLAPGQIFRGELCLRA